MLNHPTGSFYWTHSSDNPKVTFGGGTWEQIKGKFLWAKEDSQTAGSDGGAKTVTLTTNNLPSHNHYYTPSGNIALNAHSHTVTPTGSIDVTGASYTPAGSVSVAPTVTGASYTPAGTVTVTPKVTGAKYTPAGSVTVTPTVTGAKYTPKGTVSVTTNPTFSGTEVTSVSGGNWDFRVRANSYSGSGERFRTADAGTNTTWSNAGDDYTPLTMANKLDDRGRDKISHSGHTHKVTAEGTISGGSYSFSGNEDTITPTVTAEGSFKGTDATITPTVTTESSFKGTTATITPTVTATANFIGTAVTITPSASFRGNSNTTSSVTTTGSFSGTRTTTESTGSGTAVDKMPPYIIEYCWKRTA